MRVASPADGPGVMTVAAQDRRLEARLLFALAEALLLAQTTGWRHRDGHVQGNHGELDDEARRRYARSPEWTPINPYVGADEPPALMQHQHGVALAQRSRFCRTAASAFKRSGMLLAARRSERLARAAELELRRLADQILAEGESRTTPPVPKNPGA